MSGAMHEAPAARSVTKDMHRKTMVRKGVTPAPLLSDQPRALIVDDDAVILSLLDIFLQRIVSVETATNGKEALQKVRQRHYDVIISDIEMPDLNGIDFYRHAALSDPSIGDRFLFISGSVDDHAGFLRDNNIRYYRKPLLFDELTDAVVRILHQDGQSIPGGGLTVGA